MENIQEQIAQLEKKMLSMEAEKQARDANRIKLEHEIRPLFQAWSNLDIKAKFVQTKACRCYSSERAITGALYLGM